MLPQRAVFETLTVADGAAADDARLGVADDRVTVNRVEAVLVHVPKRGLQPLPQ
jgi:hypothetical protein